MIKKARLLPDELALLERMRPGFCRSKNPVAVAQIDSLLGDRMVVSFTQLSAVEAQRQRQELAARSWT